MTNKAVSKMLELKGFARDTLEAEMKRIRADLEREKERLRALEENYTRSAAELWTRQQSGSVLLHDMELLLNPLFELAKQIELQKDVVTNTRSELGRRQQAVFEAYKEERLMKLLYDKLTCRELAAASACEQKEADELFLRRRSD